MAIMLNLNNESRTTYRLCIRNTYLGVIAGGVEGRDKVAVPQGFVYSVHQIYSDDSNKVLVKM